LSAVVLLFACGILLLGLEVVVPGAVLGIVGGILLLVGVGISFDRFGPEGGALASAAALVIGGIAFYLEFVLLPRSRLAKKFSMTATVAGTSQPAVADAALVGRLAVAATPLAPSGLIECGGRRYEAFARSGHVPAGAAVEVVGIDTFRVIVTLSTNPTSSNPTPS
jgi:membrane-bound serine protease (ClpP class)